MSITFSFVACVDNLCLNRILELEQLFVLFMWYIKNIKQKELWNEDSWNILGLSCNNIPGWSQAMTRSLKTFEIKIPAHSFTIVWIILRQYKVYNDKTTFIRFAYKLAKNIEKCARTYIIFTFNGFYNQTRNFISKWTCDVSSHSLQKLQGVS